MDKQISVEDFIRHTKNMIEIAKEQDNASMEAFLNSVLIYFEQYVSTFCK